LRAPHVVLRGAVTPTPRFIAIERAIRAAPIRLSLYARRSPALTSSCRASRTCATSLPPLRAAFFHPASALGRKHHLCNSRTRCCLRPASRNAPVPCFGGHRRKRRPVRWTRPVHAPCSVIQKAKEEAVAPVALLPQIDVPAGRDEWDRRVHASWDQMGRAPAACRQINRRIPARGCGPINLFFQLLVDPSARPRLDLTPPQPGSWDLARLPP
jgi:hypothetical protein